MENITQDSLNNEKYIVISLGGSLIVPDTIDTVFISEFISLIKEYVNNGFKFVIITGGGSVARDYNNATRNIMDPTNEDLDIIGIASTRLNAQFIRVLLGDIADFNIILDPDVIPNINKPVLVGGGWKPGNSSDLASTHIARTLNISKVINLSNIKYVYDKDPKKFKDAQSIKQITWTEFIKLLPNKWEPGLNAPFDPIAARDAQEQKLEVVIMDGKDIDNLKNYLDGKNFIGTKIN